MLNASNNNLYRVRHGLFVRVRLALVDTNFVSVEGDDHCVLQLFALAALNLLRSVGLTATYIFPI